MDDSPATAAASHDLRQPLHALGLFAEALRHRIGTDAEVAHLVNSINSSVDALEGLFSELLDSLIAEAIELHARRQIPLDPTPEDARLFPRR